MMVLLVIGLLRKKKVKGVGYVRDLPLSFLQLILYRLGAGYPLSPLGQSWYDGKSIMCSSFYVYNVTRYGVGVK